MSSRRKSKGKKGKSQTLHYAANFLATKTKVERSSLAAKKEVQRLLAIYGERHTIKIINMAYLVTINSHRVTLFPKDLHLSDHCKRFYK